MEQGPGWALMKSYPYVFWATRSWPRPWLLRPEPLWSMSEHGVLVPGSWSELGLQGLPALAATSRRLCSFLSFLLLCLILLLFLYLDSHCVHTVLLLLLLILCGWGQSHRVRREEALKLSSPALPTPPSQVFFI